VPPEKGQTADDTAHPPLQLYGDDMDEIIRRVKIFEGYSEKPYLCPAGKWTIGYGYNYDDRGFSVEMITEILEKGFSRDTAEKLLERDVKECISALDKLFPFYRGLSEPRRAVVTDMVYQLGLKGFQLFKRMIKALEQGDHQRAALEMQNSRWYKQSGRRSLVNTVQMRTGEWEEIL